MNVGNILAAICRVIILILEIYGMILSSFDVLPSCHFIDAVSTNDEQHGVGLKSFETENNECIPHNSYIKEYYNGMEMVAKVCGYVAPSLASVVVVWLMGECCKKGGCWSGKCIPLLLMMGCVVCQGLTFLMFNSALFCKNEDIKVCSLGSAAIKSIHACVVYGVAFILYYVAPNPKPLTEMIGMGSVATSNSSRSGGDGKQKQKKKSKPDSGEEYTREMYAQRRKEKNIKSRGVSGRKKKEIFNDLNGGNNSREIEEPYDESQIALYDPETGQRKEDEKRRRSGRTSPQPLYGDYVDEPDGMDWSAYTPNERDEYQERRRARKKQHERGKKEQSRGEILDRREYELRYHDRHPPQDDDTFRSEYTEEYYDRQPFHDDETEYTEDQYDDRDRRYDERSRGYDDRYDQSYRSNDDGYGRHEDSYRSNPSSRSGDRRGSYDYDDGYSYQSAQDEFSAYDSRAGDRYYDQPEYDDSYYERGSGRGDDYSYDSRANDHYGSSRSRQSERGGFYS